MDDRPATGCPDCAELRKRIDQLTEEQGRNGQRQGLNKALNVLLFLMLCVGSAIELVDSTTSPEAVMPHGTASLSSSAVSLSVDCTPDRARLASR